MKASTAGLLALPLLLALAVYFGWAWSKSAVEESALQRYENAAYGISFEYPDTYQLEERTQPGSGMRRHDTITLIKKTDAANIPVGGEGPTAITLDVLQNNLDKQSPEDWIRNSNVSNFKLSVDNRINVTEVAGATAFSYTWDGLYRGDSVVLAHQENILMFSVTYMTAEDEIRRDFAALLESVKLD